MVLRKHDLNSQLTVDGILTGNVEMELFRHCLNKSGVGNIIIIAKALGCLRNPYDLAIYNHVHRNNQSMRRYHMSVHSVASIHMLLN